MYNENPHFITPPDETIVWRYMNFTKFFSLIDDSMLYFPSALKLAEIDPYEGSYAQGNVRAEHLEILGDNYFGSDFNPNILRKQQQSHRLFVKDRLRKSVYINSWYMNDSESAAMWKIYAENEDGIAIKSTVGRLKKALLNIVGYQSGLPIQDIMIGKIEYIDYENGLIPCDYLLKPFLHKRRSYEHEHELRIIVADSSAFNLSDPLDLPDGVRVTANLHNLIESVFVSPTTPDWIKKLTSSIISQKRLDKEVIKSSMNDGGLW